MLNPCPHCGVDNPASAKFCRNCGQAFADAHVRSLTRVSPLMQKWRRLNQQVTRKEARKLLGEPARVTPQDSSDPAACESWLYEYAAADDPTRATCGELRFRIAEGRLVSWTEPDWTLVG